MRRTALVLPLLAALACTDTDADGQLDGLVADPMTIDYAPELAVDLDQMTETESGLYYRDLTVGDGPVAESGQTVTVHYTGWLPNGRQFDSSRDRGELFSFDLGEGQVIQGWDEGVAGMRVGGRRQLVIPPHLAYGSRGAGGVIPPNATLVFDVELFETRN